MKVYKRSKQHHPHRNSRNFITMNAAMSFEAQEAYKTARTNLMFAVAASDSKAVVFTSHSPAEGKTTTSVNIGMALAQTGSRVLIIDADMRKPAVHTMLRISHPTGLSSVLSKQCDLAAAIKQNVEPNLDVIVAGTIPPNPAELLASPQMAIILAQLSKVYDYILMDTPPLGYISDALLLNKYIAGYVLVVREKCTTHGEIEKLLRNIGMADGKVLGFIKAGCTRNQKKYYKRSKYEYYYKYYVH